MIGTPRKTIPIQIHFFLMYAGICPMAVFGSTIARQYGFADTSVAFLYFFVPIVSVVSRIAMGMVADKYHLLKPIKVACLIACAVAAALTSLVPKRDAAAAAAAGAVATTLWCSPAGTVVDAPAYDHLFCRRPAVENLQPSTCQVLCNNNANFRIMCSEWQNALINGTTEQKLDFNCEQITADLQFFRSTFSNSTCSSAKIQKVNDSQLEIPQPRCTTDRNATCSVSCAKNDLSLESELRTPSLWYLFVLYIIFGAGYYVAVTFSDTISFQLLGDEPHLYGKLRVPGSFGWGLGGFATGMLIDYFSGHNSMEKNYLPMFIFVAIVMLIDTLWSVTKIKVEGSSNTFDLKKINQLFVRFDVKVFVFWSFIAGFVQQVTWQYTFWYIEEISEGEDVNWLKTLQGFLAFSNTVTGDVISFYLSGWLFRKVGFKNCMSISLFMGAVRFFLYSILKNPFLSIPLSSFDGVLYGLQYSLITSYCNSIAVPGTEATVQAVFNCIFDGIGTSVGGLCGGLFYSWYGGALMFRKFGFMSIGCGVLHLLLRKMSA